MPKKPAVTRQPMTPAQIYAHLAKALGVRRSQAREWLLELERLARQELQRVGEFEIPRILRISLRRPARVLQATVMLRLEPRMASPAIVNKDTKVKGSWHQLRNSIRTQWGQLTDDDIARLQVHADTLAGRLQERYGYAREHAEREAAVVREVVRVFYGTDRAPSSQPGHFGSARGKILSLGWADVSVPTDHRLAVVERPSLVRFEVGEDPDKHFVIVARHVYSEPDAFWSDLRKLSQSAANEAFIFFIFIHGFNVGFDDAVYRTAQLSTDLQWKGLTLLYSWASNGRFVRYSGDVENNDNTVKALKGFLLDVATKTGVTTVHVIAHSMGNRALANALHQVALAQAHESLKIKNLILTAPDIDADVFRNIASEIAKTARRTTLYASSKDKALKLSKRRARYPRAGDAREIVVVDGVDTIDATELHTDFVSHAYYGDNDSVLSDIHELFLHDTAPPRFGQEGVPRTAPKYWRFQARR